eukprot:scaffold158_cov105-Cylindrotheca_fusiformis.AAC.11
MKFQSFVVSVTSLAGILLPLLRFTAAEDLGEAKYDYTLNGQDNCVLINVAMDESGSMLTEHAWMKDVALPTMVNKLSATSYGYDHIFVCSHGFGDDSQNPDVNNHGFRFLGCSRGYDASILAWTATNAIDQEDGYHAIHKAIEQVSAVIGGVDLASTCGTMKKNMILVTDEDRDIAVPSITSETVRNEIASKDYILNLVVDIAVGDVAENNIGARFDYELDMQGSLLVPPVFGPAGYAKFYSDFDNEVFAPDGQGGWLTKVPSQTGEYWERQYQEYVDVPYTNLISSLNGQSASEYYALVANTRGAIWAISVLEKGIDSQVQGFDPDLSVSFANAFIDIKVEEITNDCESPPCGNTEVGGDPHITTWKGEHYEYHGQCDLVMAKDDQFANGLGLDVHIRTKIVRFWSYIKNVAIRIGSDILEIEGSADPEDGESHYWINYEYQGDLEDNFAGLFPVTITAPSTYKRIYEIDLSSKYPGEKIAVHIYKEFVRVKFAGGAHTFGKTVGLLGDYKTGKTLARDGATVMDDFTELGNEWQVLPAEPKLFHEVSHPQFPERCLEPEDPRGERRRRRRLDENTITEEQAEAACASALNDPAAQKDCVYDILATQDVGMRDAILSLPGYNILASQDIGQYMPCSIRYTHSAVVNCIYPICILCHRKYLKSIIGRSKCFYRLFLSSGPSAVFEARKSHCMKLYKRCDERAQFYTDVVYSEQELSRILDPRELEI